MGGSTDEAQQLMSFTRTGTASAADPSAARRERRAGDADDEPLEGVAPEEQGSDSEDDEEKRPVLSIN